MNWLKQNQQSSIFDDLEMWHGALKGKKQNAM